MLRDLLDNAVKVSPGGKIAVDLSAADGEVTISVRDHGPCIAPERREAIFERFYRGEHSPGGLGLGLHVSRHIVQLHGGSIAADFPSDGGTRIIVRLPRGAGAGTERVEVPV